MPPLTEVQNEVSEIQASLGAPPRGFTRVFRGSLAELLHPPSHQIAFLHGLRALAVLLVINFHVSETFSAAPGGKLSSNLPFVSNGCVGVDLFFVLSGFFIGEQLWKELWASGSISVRRFIVRRGLRIWPLYFFTFLCVLLLFPHRAAEKQFGWTDLVFLSNYVYHDIVLGGWSLCTEEQFYLLAPLLLLLFARDRSRRWSVITLWLLFLVLPLVRASLWIQHAGSLSVHSPELFTQLFYYPFHTHCDGLLLGLILSHQWITRKHPRLSRLRAAVFPLLSLGLFLLLHQLQHEVLTFTALALFFGSLLWAGLVSRILLFRSRIFFWLSRLSFGMYLNHRYLESFVLNTLVPRLHAFPPSSIGTELLATGLLVLLSSFVALATFCLVEQPFLHLRSILLQPASSPVESVSKPARVSIRQ